MYTNQLSIDSGEALSYENNDDNDDFNIDIDADEFIGRDEELKDIKAHWNTCKLFGIFGTRSVGKSKLVNEFIKTQNRKRFELLRVDVGLINDPSKLYPNLCALLKQEPDNELLKSDEWMNDIARHLNSIPCKCYVIFFDNTEDCQDLKGPEVRDAFLSFIPTLAKQCKYVKIFITSTTRIQFTLLRKVYFSLELKPLKPVHAGELLRSVISENVDLGEYESSIVKLSEGLPLLLKMIGSELSEDEGMLTPQDIVELLAKCRLKALSKEYYPPEDRVDYVYKKFIDRLEPKFRDYLTTLEFIPGPFLAEQARDMLGYETTALVKNDVLVHHRRRHLLEYDPTQKRFNIQGILRECFQTFYTVKNIAEVRTRYCRVFSTVMTNITKRLGTEEYTKALSEFSVEQPNLEKLLTEVRYTSQDNYKFFIQMATNCTELIERFMTSRCDDFYQCCIKASEMYGQVVDKASVNIAVGSLYTNTKGDLVHGEINYSSALPVLEQNGPSLQLATAYQRMGWNMLQQAKNEDAVSYFQKSLAISSISGKEYELIMLQTLSSMGVTLTVLGNFDDAERYHFACLKRRREVQGPNHPSIGSTLNNIGIMYDQKEDHEKALEYYTQGLEIKKKYNAPVISMVFSLTNSANACMMVKKYSQAHSHLNEALERLLGQTVTPREALAHTYDSKGKAFRSEKKYELAADMFEKGLELRKEIATETMPYMESLVHLADANRRLENFDKSRKLCTKALKMKSKAIKAMPQNSFISECLECLSEIYKMKEDNIDRYRDTLIQIEAELLRLESVYVSQGNERGLERIRDKMVNVKDRLQTVKVQKKCEVLYKREL